MSRRMFVDFRAVKSAVSIVQILGHYGLTEHFKANAKGDSLSGPCPIHKGQNPTQFRVSIEKNCWHCFSECQHGGNILDLVALLEDCSIREAALRIADWFSLPLEQKPESRSSKVDEEARRPDKQAAGSVSSLVDEQEPARASASKREHPQEPATAQNEDDTTPNKPLGFQLKNLDAAHPYITERGLSEETIATFGLGLCSKGSMTGRIVIPIHDAEGALVAYAGRWPGEPPKEDTPKYRFPAGFRKSLELFNYHRAAAGEAEMPLVVVEGFFGAIWLSQAGYARVVALMGNTLSGAQEAGLYRLCEADERLILLLDGDEAGGTGAKDALVRLSRRLYVRCIALGEERQPDHLSPEELGQVLNFPAQ